MDSLSLPMQVRMAPVLKKRKKSLSKWSSYPTVCWHLDAQKDRSEVNKTIAEDPGWIVRAWHELQCWLIPGLIGVLTASCGAFIDLSVEFCSSLRFGYCSSSVFLTEEHCGSGWVSWNHSYWSYAGISCLVVLPAALLVRFVAPAARGSGIPEVKTVLGGFVLENVLAFKTLVTKIVGLGFSVGAGLSCGKEGPLVHIACCWSNCLAHWVPRWRHNEAKRRELLSTAAAAGVSVAFGAPLGGVLFSYEEVSTMFPSRIMIIAFFSASMAAITLDWWNPTGTGKLTLFQTLYTEPPAFSEYIGFVFLGVVGGLLGAVFVRCNIAVCEGRRKGSPWRNRIPEVLEVLMICLLTAITSYPNLYTRGLSSPTIHSLFHRCSDQGPEAPGMFGLCDGTEPRVGAALARELLVAAALRFVQMTFTFGAGVPAGLFIPCLYTGACLGRVVGIAAHHINSMIPGSTVTIHPGVYAMVGAASVLGGVCRVTISLVVIMFELTGGLQMVVPFMIACLLAKWTGDAFTGGIYDDAIKSRGYPYLHEPEGHGLSSKTAEDVMDSVLEVCTCETQTIAAVLEKMRNAKYSGFPLIKSEADPVIVGYLHAAEVIRELEEMRENQRISENSTVTFMPCTGVNAMDVSSLVDVTVHRVVMEMPVHEVHEMFRKLGIKIILVEKFGVLVGMITKKCFIDAVESWEHASVEEHHPGSKDCPCSCDLGKPLLTETGNNSSPASSSATAPSAMTGV